MKIFGSTIACLLFSSSIYANTCDLNSDQMQSQISQVQDLYAEKFKNRADAVNREAKELESQSPDPSAVEATFDVQIDVDWKVTEMKFHVPEFKLENKKIVFDLPQVMMKEQTWIYHTPSVRMEQECMNKPPETVCGMKTKCIGGGWSKICTDVPECRTRAGGQMCTDIPKTFMQEQRTILHVPETKMEKTEIIVGLPVSEMKLQAWKMHLPQFTVKSVSGQIKDIKDRAADMEQREKNANEALSGAMKSEIKEISILGASQIFDCHFTALNDQKMSALVDIDKNIRVVEGALKNANEVGASDLAKSMKSSLEKLISARNEVTSSFDKAISDLSIKKEEAVNKLNN